MARRGGGSATAQLQNGREAGVQITDRDLTRLRHIARWYCITPWHIYRWENGLSNALTHTTRSGGTETGSTGNIRRRLSKLAAIQTAANGIGPLVNVTEIIGQSIAYNTTSYGAALADIPWQLPPTVNPGNARHAFEAADIGMHLESIGANVLSERELSSTSDINGEPPPPTLISQYHSDTGTTTTKKPDLAVIAEDGDFIAVEIERMKARPLRVYREKLTAYRENPALRAIWYLSDNDATLRRVAAAARAVFDTDNLTPEYTGVPIRFARMDDHRGWYTLPGVNADGEATTKVGAAFIQDLNSLTADRTDVQGAALNGQARHSTPRGLEGRRGAESTGAGRPVTDGGTHEAHSAPRTSHRVEGAGVQGTETHTPPSPSAPGNTPRTRHAAPALPPMRGEEKPTKPSGLPPLRQRPGNSTQTTGGLPPLRK